MDQDLTARVDALLPRVTRPARYLDGEINTIHHPWESQRVRWLLILPDIYEIGMSHQGLRILYDILNHRDDALAERAFAPWVDMDALMRQKGVPLFSLESRRPAREFDVIGFSLQYELLATNILNLLDLAGIPLESRARSEEDPLIAAGGPCSGNPEPLADFIDFFLIGDGEEAVAEITTILSATRGQGREVRLRALADVAGVYVPRFYEPRFENGRQIGVEPRDGVPFPVRRTYVRDLDAALYPLKPLVPLTEVIQDRLTLEIQRGCTQGCRFCQAGIFYRPVRERSPGRLVEIVASSLAASGWSEVSLSSLSSADYSQIRRLARTLIEALYPKRIGLSFSSLRVDTFSVELAELVARVRKTGLTFAPEAGSERLRHVLNKDIGDEDVLAAVEAAYEKGWRRVKLYFMIGLPTETDADLAAIAELVERIRTLGRRHGGTRSVTASIGSFVPKAHTPFQWEAFGPRESLGAKLAALQEQIRGRGMQLKWHDVDLSFVEAVLSRGDRRLGASIRKVWERGARFDGWTEQFDIVRWEGALADSGIDPDTLICAQDAAAPLAWDHIDLGVRRDWLLQERKQAHAGRITADCRTAACNNCGLGGPRERRLAQDLGCEEWERLSQELTAGAAMAEAGPGETPGRTEPAHSADGRAETLPRRRVRVVYAKRGSLRFISHLETGRLLTRLFRMAHWPLAFTAGHSPRPRLSFGPPLPLGIAGEQEIIDVQLTAELTSEHLKRANERAPRGLEIRAFGEIPLAVRSLTREAVAATYLAELPRDLADRARQEERLEDFAAASALLVSKPSRGRQRSVDLKRCVLRLEWAPAPASSDRAPAHPRPGADPPPDAEPPADVELLRMELRLQEPDGHVIGPLPLLREVFKWSQVDLARCRVTRRRLLNAEGQPLDHLPAEGS